MTSNFDMDAIVTANILERLTKLEQDIQLRPCKKNACKKVIDSSKPVEVRSTWTASESCSNLSVCYCPTKTSSETCSLFSYSETLPDRLCCRLCTSSRVLPNCGCCGKSANNGFNNNSCGTGANSSPHYWVAAAATALGPSNNNNCCHTCENCIHSWDEAATTPGRRILYWNNQYRFCLELQKLTKQAGERSCRHICGGTCRLGDIIDALDDRIAKQIDVLRTLGCALHAAMVDNIATTLDAARVDNIATGMDSVRMGNIATTRSQEIVDPIRSQKEGMINTGIETTNNRDGTCMHSSSRSRIAASTQTDDRPLCSGKVSIGNSQTRPPKDSNHLTSCQSAQNSAYSGIGGLSPNDDDVKSSVALNWLPGNRVDCQSPAPSHQLSSDSLPLLSPNSSPPLRSLTQSLPSLVPSQSTSLPRLHHTMSSPYPQLEAHNLKIASNDTTTKVTSDLSTTTVPVPPKRTRKPRGSTKTLPYPSRTGGGWERAAITTDCCLTENEDQKLGRTAIAAVQMRIKSISRDIKPEDLSSSRRHCLYFDKWPVNSIVLTESKSCEGLVTYQEKSGSELRNSRSCEGFFPASATKELCRYLPSDRLLPTSSPIALAGSPFSQSSGFLFTSSSTSLDSISPSQDEAFPTCARVEIRRKLRGSKGPVRMKDIRGSRSSKDFFETTRNGDFRSLSPSSCRSESPVRDDASLNSASVEIRQKNLNTIPEIRRSRSSDDLRDVAREESITGTHRRSVSLGASKDDRTSHGGLRVQFRREESSCTTHSTSGELSTSSSRTHIWIVDNVPCDRNSTMERVLCSIDKASAAEAGYSGGVATVTGGVHNVTIVVDNSSRNVTKSSVIQNARNVQVGDSNRMVGMETSEGQNQSQNESGGENKGHCDANGRQSDYEEEDDGVFEDIIVESADDCQNQITRL